MLRNIIDYRGVNINRKELAVLKNVNLSVTNGEFIYLIGKVGSGKSSLLKSMYCEVPIEDGEATVLGYNLDKIRKRDIPMLRRKIGIVFQDFQLLTDRSIYDNLEFVLRATGWASKSEIDNRIAEVLTQVSMENKSYKMPHELSGGEQQRVVIARALLNDPQLILADEPTGNLDTETGHQIVLLLRDIAKNGTTIIMATHNLNIVEQFSGRVLKCENKQILDINQ